MFCPVCESEYEAGITRCPDDDAELVVSLSPEQLPDLSEASFVPLHRLSSTAEAEMVNDILRKNGIRSAIQGASNDAFSPLLSVMAPGAIVLVDERDVDRAREIYSSFFGEDITPLSGGLGDESEPEDEGE